MNRHLLGWAVAAALSVALPAQAIQLSRTGSGQVLLFPYYTVNGGNLTLLSLVNGTNRGKAVRVFFREGMNSRLAAEITIFLSPNDVWTAAVFEFSSNSPANIVTLDHSCTSPALNTSTTLPVLGNGEHYLPFSNATFSGAAHDAGSDALTRTREGHFEVIELGEIVNDDTGLFDAIVQGPNGIPVNCAFVENGYDAGGVWSIDATAGLGPPTGGLYGSAYAIDTLEGIMQFIPADAIDQFSGSVLNSPPGHGQPTLAFADTGNFRPTIAANIVVDGVLSAFEYPQGTRNIDAVSALLTANAIYNDFVTGINVGGASEWVVTFPTKHFYTDGATAIAPFLNVFPVEGEGTAPVNFLMDVRTRAGVLQTCIPPYSYQDCLIGVPPPASPARLNWATNVVTFNQAEGSSPTSAILGSTLVVPVNLYDIYSGNQVSEGSTGLSFWSDAHGAPYSQQQLRPDASGKILHGLPVQGFWSARYTNNQVVPGVLANYSDAISHQRSRSSTSSAP